MTRAIFLGVLLAGLSALCACAAPGERAGYLSRAIHADDPQVVLTAGSAVLRREFGRVTIDDERRTVESVPAEYVARRDSGSARDLYGGRSQMRRIAKLRVGRRGDQVVAWLRVDVEREDTERVLVQQQTGRQADMAANTPIERDAATTERQNTVWSFVRRDYELERRLLAELQEQFAPAPSEAAGSTSAERPATQPAGDK